MLFTKRRVGPLAVPTTTSTSPSLSTSPKAAPLLTSSSFDSAEQLLSDASVARGVAYVSIGAAAGQTGSWSVQGATTQGDVSSWLFAGSFLAREAAVHRYEAGMAYAAQRYTGT